LNIDIKLINNLVPVSNPDFIFDDLKMRGFIFSNQTAILGMEKPMQTMIDKKAGNKSINDTDSNKRKRNRISKKSEVTVHQWTFSTEVK